ncbi:MAG: UbiD family decarboxylase [Betaproteobacteria bacterium]|nr:UbiD family decarboxylase [Betaproteobacteria bacterium]
MDLKTTVRAGQSALDAWIGKAEALGELMRITREIDPDLEMSTVAHLSNTQGGPALLFENIKGHPGQRALYNMVGLSVNRFCLTMGEAPVPHPLDAVQMLKRKIHRKLPWQEVSPQEAISSDNVATGDAIDIWKFPAPRMWPLDGGKYLGTGDAVVTRDPETGRVNLGCYRMMIKGPREIGLYISPGHDGHLDREKWWRQGKPMPVAAAFGIDPLLFLVAATTFPKTESEYDYYSGIHGSPIQVFTGDVTGLPLPASAEIILEGFLHPGETFAEGPFGEFTGYYGRPGDAAPYMRVEKVRYRNNPTLTCALANESGLLCALTRAAAVWAEFEKLGIPGIQGVWSVPEATGVGITVVSLKQMYAGHASQVMSLAAQVTSGAYFNKYVIVVDDDVDPTNCVRGSLGDGDALPPRPVDRYPQGDLERLSGSEPEPARDPALGLQVPHQRLHGIPLHQDFFESLPAVQACVRQGFGKVERIGVSWEGAQSVDVRRWGIQREIQWFMSRAWTDLAKHRFLLFHRSHQLAPLPTDETSDGKSRSSGPEGAVRCACGCVNYEQDEREDPLLLPLPFSPQPRLAYISARRS